MTQKKAFFKKARAGQPVCQMVWKVAQGMADMQLMKNSVCQMMTQSAPWAHLGMPN